MKAKRRRTKRPRERIKTHDVPCDGCVECCRNEIVFLHPGLRDKASEYETQLVGGRYALAQRDNGDCIYLGATGCTIYSRRPAVCRELDCAVFLENALRLLQLGLIEMRHIVAAKRRMERDQ